MLLQSALDCFVPPSRTDRWLSVCPPQLLLFFIAAYELAFYDTAFAAECQYNNLHGNFDFIHST